MAGIGDTLLATPFIRELRANYPDAQIDALVLWAGWIFRGSHSFSVKAALLCAGFVFKWVKGRRRHA